MWVPRATLLQKRYMARAASPPAPRPRPRPSLPQHLLEHALLWLGRPQGGGVLFTAPRVRSAFGDPAFGTAPACRPSSCSRSRTRCGMSASMPTLMSRPYSRPLIPVSRPSFCRVPPGMRSIHPHKCRNISVDSLFPSSAVGFHSARCRNPRLASPPPRDANCVPGYMRHSMPESLHNTASLQQEAHSVESFRHGIPRVL